MSSRVDHFVGFGGITDFDFSPENKIVMRDMEGSLFSRTVAAWFRSILRFLGRITPQKMVGEIDKKLTAAGNPGNLRAQNSMRSASLHFSQALGWLTGSTRIFQSWT